LLYFFRNRTRSNWCNCCYRSRSDFDVEGFHNDSRPKRIRKIRKGKNDGQMGYGESAEKKFYRISSLGCDSIWVEFSRVFKIKFLNLISIQFFYSHEIKSVELKFLKVLNCSRLNFLNSVEDSPNIKARKMSVDLTKEKYTNHLLDLLGDVNKLLKKWHSFTKSI
jgi:hypothetical protein